MTYTYSDESKTLILCSDGRTIPVCPGNRDYDELVEIGQVISDFVPDPNAAVKRAITDLENQMTRRRTREALISEAGRAWVEDIDNQIAELRSKLV